MPLGVSPRAPCPTEIKEQYCRCASTSGAVRPVICTTDEAVACTPVKAARGVLGSHRDPIALKLAANDPAGLILYGASARNPPPYAIEMLRGRPT